jgi:hypothetical protein
MGTKRWAWRETQKARWMIEPSLPKAVLSAQMAQLTPYMEIVAKERVFQLEISSVARAQSSSALLAESSIGKRMLLSLIQLTYQD